MRTGAIFKVLGSLLIVLTAPQMTQAEEKTPKADLVANKELLSASPAASGPARTRPTNRVKTLTKSNQTNERPISAASAPSVSESEGAPKTKSNVKND